VIARQWITSSTLSPLGFFTQRRREYRDAPEVSRWDGVVGAIFILASAVIVAKVAELQFDRFFYGAAWIAAMLLVVSKSRLAYISAAFAWMALRLLGAGALAQKWWAFGSIASAKGGAASR
jgi:hypothetical protein